MTSIAVGAETRRRLRDPLWWLAAGAAAVGTAWLLVGTPWLAAGGLVGGLVLLLLLLRPLALIGAMLAIGALDFSFVTGGDKALFSAMGGLDMNGIRLIGVVLGLTALIVVDREVLRHAFGRHGRWYLAFLCFAAGTLVLSPSRVDGLRLLFKLAYPFLIFVAVSGTVRTREELARLADWVLAGAAALVVVVNPFLVLAGGYVVDASGFTRLQGLGMHQNPFSYYLLAMLLLALARYSVRGQLRYGVLAVVFGVGIVLTLSRMTFLASIAALGGIALYSGLVARNYRAVVGAAALAATVAVPLLPVALVRSLGYVPTAGELFHLLRDPAALVGAIRWGGREILWPVVFEAFLGSPVVGLGLGASTSVIAANFPADWGRVVHNEYLRLLTDTGLVGGTLFAAAVLTWGRAVLGAAREQDPLVREYALPAFAGIVAWALIAFTGNPFDYYAQFTQYIGFFCAGALAAGGLGATRHGAYLPASATGRDAAHGAPMGAGGPQDAVR